MIIKASHLYKITTDFDRLKMAMKRKSNALTATTCLPSVIFVCVLLSATDTVFHFTPHPRTPGLQVKAAIAFSTMGRHGTLPSQDLPLPREQVLIAL